MRAKRSTTKRKTKSTSSSRKRVSVARHARKQGKLPPRAANGRFKKAK